MNFLKGIYLFNFGTTSSSIFSWTTIIAGGALGYHTTSWGWRLVWSGLNLFISIGMYLSHNKPMEAVMGGMSVFLLFQVPFWVSAWVRSDDNREELEKLKGRIANMSEIQIVQFIEGYFNCLIATNHGWLKQNWHSLTDDQKCEWAKVHRKLINDELYMVTNAVDVIELMQTWSRFKNAS